ncbi:solute carrier family 28 member 3-like [Ylistrum balloti]|uniref:solute carrier family 28 member 3-like n=1 Tax=Ylistrum balloti TaxID=509963 RepID=UPI002905A84F|nr:solute carrier family 28 member 3-like [Ylistrum balloti]
MSVELNDYTIVDVDQTEKESNPDNKGTACTQNGVTIIIKKSQPGNADDVMKFDEDPLEDGCTLLVDKIQKKVHETMRLHWIQIKRCATAVSICLYFAYFSYCMYFRFGDEGSVRLLVCTLFGVLLALAMAIVGMTKTQWIRVWEGNIQPFVDSKTGKRTVTITSLLLKVIVFFVIVVYIIVDVVVDHPENLIAVSGQAIYVIIFYIFSISPGKVKWHTVFWGFALQYILALIFLRQEWGFHTLWYLGDRVREFLKHSDAGAIFMFSEPLVNRHTVAFTVFPVIIFFCTVIYILYYLEVMQFIVRVLSQAIVFSMGTTPAESFNAAANIFVGMIEAILMIGPSISDMTCSELHAVMTAGFATIAGTVMGVYISFGIPANHLIAASIMSAPAALAVSKLTYPEVEVHKSSSRDLIKMEKSKERNIIEAATAGATASIKLVSAIAVNIIAFLSLLSFINATFIWCGERAGMEDFSLEFICSYLFFPIAFFMGTDVSDCRKVAELIGIKTFTNEFIAYQKLAGIISNGNSLANYTAFYNDTAHWYWDNGNVILNSTGQELVGGIISDKSEVIATYALCSFASFGSIGFLLGSLGALAPTRKRDLARMVVRAMVSGAVVCFLNACVAGLLYKDY